MVVTLFLAEVGNPARSGTLLIDGETYRLDQLELLDESMSRWVVIDG